MILTRFTSLKISSFRYGSMRSKVPKVQTNKWIQALLPVCYGDTALAKRELQWMKEAVTLKHSGDKLKSVGTLSRKEQKQLDEFVEQRVLKQKPLQYILGSQPFCELDIISRSPTLIPRWETEEWTYKLIDIIKPKILQAHMTNKPVRILDLCTGTGCISLALAKKLPKNTVEITGIDISAAAIALAKENFALHKESLNNPVTFEQKDIFQLDSHDVEPYQLFVSNPPYVTHDEYATLEPCVRDWEDKRALVADEQGTSIHKRIIDLSRHSKPYAENTPYVFMEIGGAHQVKVLMQTMQQAGLHNISIWKDLADRDRVIVGY